MEHKLAKTIESHEGKIDTITLREPTGADLRKLGMPFDLKPGADIDAQPTIELREKIALNWVTELSDQDEGILDQCHPGDLFQLMWEVVALTADLGKSQTSKSTS